ncbi:sensor histidine kinase [Fredinandcohnia humi]
MSLERRETKLSTETRFWSWKWLDLFLLFSRTAWVLFNGLVNVIPLYTDLSSKLWLTVWFTLILFIPLIYVMPGNRKISYYLIAEYLVTGSMFLYLIHEFSKAGPDIISFISFPVLAISFVSQSRPFIWLSPIFTLILLFSGLLIGGFFEYEDTPGRLVDIVMFYAFGFILGRIALMDEKKRELIQSIEIKNKTLEQYSERIEELTLREERSRVSREMHDSIGHILTTIITSLDALPFLIKADPQQKKYIKEISDLARKGLRDVRTTIHQIAPEEENDSIFEACRIVISVFMKHTHTDIRYVTSGKEKTIGIAVKNTIIRCLQESLTNAKRHGQATKIDVILRFQGEDLTLEIGDNGVGTEIKPGFGLKTMKDRLLTVGGTLSIQSNDQNGTKVTCLIPLPKELIG